MINRTPMIVALFFAWGVSAWAQGPIRSGQTGGTRLDAPRTAERTPRATPPRVIRLRPPRPGELPPTSATLVPEVTATPPPLRVIEPADAARVMVASVDGQQLTLKEIQDQLRLVRMSFSGPTEEVERYRRSYASQILNDWADTKLLAAEARARSLTFTRDEVDRYIEGTAQDSGLRVPVADRLRLVGVSEEKFRAAVEDGLLGEKLIRRVIREKVTDEVLNDALKKSPMMFLSLMSPPRRHVRQIFYQFKGTETPDDVEAMRSKMKAIRRRLTWFGGRVEDYARERAMPDLFVHDLGWLAVGDRIDPKSQFIYDLVFRLEPTRPGKEGKYVLNKSDISEVIASPSGFHIFQVVDEQPARRKTAEEIRVDIENTFYDQVRTGLLKELEQRHRVSRDPEGLFENDPARRLRSVSRVPPRPGERDATMPTLPVPDPVVPPTTKTTTAPLVRPGR